MFTLSCRPTTSPVFLVLNGDALELRAEGDLVGDQFAGLHGEPNEQREEDEDGEGVAQKLHHRLLRQPGPLQAELSVPIHFSSLL